MGTAQFPFIGIFARAHLVLAQERVIGDFLIQVWLNSV